jgi:glucokinase
MNQLAIGIDIGGTKTSAGIVDQNGLVADTLLVERTPAREGPEGVLRLLVRMVQDLDRFGLGPLPLGAGTAGVVSADGVIRSATNAISDWPGYELRQSLVETFGREACVLNDVHAAAFGEAVLGAGRGVDSFLMVTVGTGVGGSLCRDGVPDFGATGTAGSIGHTAARNQDPQVCPCGQVGHIEAYASGPAMERAYAERTGRHLSLRDIVDIARSRDGHVVDETAWNVVSAGAAVLGTGLADALSLVDSSLIILGGGVASIPGYRELVADAVVAAALPGPSSVALRAAQLGTEATLVGAGLFVGHRNSAREGTCT